MSCGSCNIWQHIPCHEGRDRLDGRPPRDWEREEFYCSRCRAKPSANANGRRSRRSLPPSTSQQTKVQLRWDYGKSGAKPSGPAQPPYVGAPLDRHDYYQMSPAPGLTNGGYSYSHPAYNSHTSSLPTPVDQYSSISFSHYQPHQRGFTSRHPQPPIYNTAHYPNTHNSQPIYPTYSNGTGNPTVQGYPSQPGFGGHYRTSVSTVPLQVSQRSDLRPPKPDRPGRRTAWALPQTGVFHLRMSQAVLIPRPPPYTRVDTIPDCMDLLTNPFNLSMYL